MSLVSQIKDKNSPVRRFFTKFENKEGAKECLALLQSTKPIRLPPFTPASFSVYTFIGMTTDYLIRYTANENKLIFENTIAHQALERVEIFNARTGQDFTQDLENLYKIGKQYLDGRDATDHKAVYSATALTIMDKVFRSQRLPTLFSEPIAKDKKEQIKKAEGKGLKEKTTRFLFDEYYETLGGELYAQDVSEIIRMFVTATKSQESELFNARFAAFNQALGNSRLVGGADFDCVIAYDNHLILTDIKATINPLTIEQLRQIIGYALLYDENKDDFNFTDIGIYHSRSGSFRFLPIDSVIERSFSGFKSVRQAREAFISEVKKN